MNEDKRQRILAEATYALIINAFMAGFQWARKHQDAEGKQAREMIENTASDVLYKTEGRHIFDV